MALDRDPTLARLIVGAVWLLGASACHNVPMSLATDAAVDAATVLVDARPDASEHDAGWDAMAPDASPDASVLPDAALVDAAWLEDGSSDADLDARVSVDASGSDAAVLTCPQCMVLIQDTFCIDQYEASRPDASQSSIGTSTAFADCKPNVLPWHNVTKAIAQQACLDAGKRLCTVDEWPVACGGPQQTVYPYGDVYDPVICNGIDRYCFCGPGQACDGVTPCPYAHCFGDCGAAWGVIPTGSASDCTHGWDLYDMSGNVWEVVEAFDSFEHWVGGACNCLNSELLHQCATNVTWTPNRRGFRCCADPS